MKIDCVGYPLTGGFDELLEAPGKPRKPERMNRTASARFANARPYSPERQLSTKG